MRNVEIQKKLCVEYLTPENVLSYVLVHEKGTKIHQQYLKFPTYNAVQRPQYIKNEPTLNIVENNKCLNCGQQFKKGHLTTCPARDRNCNTCGRKGHFFLNIAGFQQGHKQTLLNRINYPRKRKYPGQPAGKSRI